MIRTNQIKENRKVVKESRFVDCTLGYSKIVLIIYI